jgi:hypothetical protein
MKVFKSLSFYPFLFILYAVLAPAASNLDQVPATLALRSLAVLLVAAGFLLLLLYAIFRDGKYAAYLVFLLAAFFFTFGHLVRLAQDRLKVLDDQTAVLLFLGSWAVLMLGLSLRSAWIRLGGRTWMAPFFNIVFFVALISPVYQILSGSQHLFPSPAVASNHSSLNAEPTLSEIKLDCSSTPDIYYIVMDGYARADVLEGLYGLDNRPFLEYLRSKGFFVAGESHTNYTQTIFSLPSTLNFDYIDLPTGSQEDGQYFLQRINDNRLMSLLKQCGYRIAVLKSGFYYTDQIPADLHLTGSGLLNEFEGLLLADSPYSFLAQALKLDPPEQSYLAHRQRVLDSFSQLKNAAQIAGPKIVFAHLITPHPPFIFNEDGRNIDVPRGYSIGDGDDFGGEWDEYRRGYTGQLRFANRKLEEAIDAILANSESPPVIIIQGDHGAGSGLDWDSPEATCLWERSAILNAYYLPNEGTKELYPSISPVNTFRVVLNSVFGTDLPLLPDRTYFTSHRLIRQAIDITEERDSKGNCQK